MIIFYNIFLFFYKTFIHIAAFFGNDKAKLWVNGRKDIFNKIKNSLSSPKEEAVDNQNVKIVWMHVASLGEFEQGRPIIEMLKKEQLARGNWQLAKGKEQLAKGKEQLAIGNEQSLLGNEQSLLGNKQSLLGNEQGLLGNEQSLLDNKQSLLGNEQSLLGNEQSLLSNEQSLLRNEQSLLGNQQSLLSNEQSLLGNQQSLLGNQQSLLGNEQSLLGNEQSTINDNEYKIILTFFSPSGYELRKNYAFADHVFYLPLDSADNARQFLDLIKPDLAIFVKYEFWYHYLTELYRRTVPTLLVSAIFRDKQFSVTNPYTPILIRVLKTFNHIFVQDTPSVFLLKKQGLTAVSCVGDTRIDRVLAISKEANRFAAIEQFVGDAPVFIGGSTWQPDEEIIATLFSDVRFKDWRFIFAPHDISPKNIARLQQLLPEPSLRYSEINEQLKTPLNIQNSPRILIIDNVGMLSAVYQFGRVAYIGGGFGSGIHNTLEPIAFGLPVIFGLKYKKFAEAVSLVETGGGFSVANAIDLKQVMTDLLLEENYKKAADAALSYVENNKGATVKIIEFINKK
jgi:3-deoxy-D-manno-octulosonic-acid transferase